MDADATPPSPQGLRRLFRRASPATPSPAPLPEVLPVYLGALRLPSSFGGVTNAMLQHARMLSRTVSSDVTVVALDDEPDAAAREADLRDRGLLTPGVTYRSMWAELREPGSASWLRGKVLPELPVLPEHASVRTVGPAERPVATVYLAPAGAAIATDHYRSDGSLLVREVRSEGRPVSYACATGDGRVVELRGVRGLRRRWLAHVVKGPATLVVESKGLLATVAGRPLPGVRRVFVVHGSHLSKTAADAHGPLDPKRSDFLAHLDDFDRVVFLTHAQERDVVERCGARPGFAVIPNARDIEPVAAHRDPERGVVVARLVADKGVDAVVRATDAAAQAAGRRLVLDVLGEGPERGALERIGASLTHADVRFHGHVHDVPARFAGASFSVLASKTEGHPLVLVESMAQGCIPVAYDIRYGPSEIVEAGVSGLLVPAGDEAALAAAVKRLVTMEPERLGAMRRAARERARAFSEAAVGKSWVELLASLDEEATPEGPSSAGARAEAASR
jgi:poly(glycerol-phosphate) alpha-glucosyltransferase